MRNLNYCYSITLIITSFLSFKRKGSEQLPNEGSNLCKTAIVAGVDKQSDKVLSVTVDACTSSTEKRKDSVADEVTGR